ncbi:MAG TPA: hypothetical protein VFO39_09850 [Candidatus Sulfotelmatobacter sp.]|nr:hypothetical protein [Candidatus Sulfotelmatobacter sp.]
MINTTPVLMELNVCHSLRDAEPNDRAISFLAADADARSAPFWDFLDKSLQLNSIASLIDLAEANRLGENTHDPNPGNVIWRTPKDV